MEPTNKSLKDQVLTAIETGQVKMKPKSYFVLKGLLMAIGTAIVFLALLYSLSLVIFILKQTGAGYAPGFGAPGFKQLFFSLPWLLILLSFGFIVILEIFVNRYEFTHKKPLIYTATVVIIFVILGSYAAHSMALHSMLMEKAYKNQVPFAGAFYKNCCQKPHGPAFVGQIVEFTEYGYLTQDTRGDLIKVSVTPKTIFPFGKDLMLNDIIVVLGEPQGNFIQALGIKELPALPRGKILRTTR